MNTIDCQQLYDSLKEKLNHREILKQAEIKKLNIPELQESFETIQKLLDLHEKVNPASHTQDILMMPR